MINKYEVGTLILRVVLGLVFLFHGLDKFQSGIGNTAGWFESIGLPGLLAYAVALIEMVGGILLIIGLFSRIVSGLLVVIMAGAVITVNFAEGFLGGYELDLALMAMAIFIFLNGAKKYSLDRIINNGKAEPENANVL